MLWKELTKTALLGTDHSRLSSETLDALQAQGIDVQQPTARILLDAAALFIQLRKAAFPLEDYPGELPPPAIRESENICSTDSVHHLYLILTGSFAEVFPEFVECLLENGRLLPPESLPLLLQHPGIELWWEKLQPALGVQCRWLLAQNPAWQQWNAQPASFDWHTGNKNERRLLLRHLRMIAPAKALALLESTWQQEDFRDKVDFLKQLETGLSNRDEPFLESCLDERRKEVRETAARLLAKMTGSQLARRMIHRAQHCLTLQEEMLSVNIPAEPDEQSMRDGIAKYSPAWEGGSKAAYLGQTIAATHPQTWETFFQKKPDEVLQLFVTSDWAGTLLKASVEAAVLHNHHTWMEAVAAFWLDAEALPLWETPSMEYLLQSLSAKAVNRLALSVLKKQHTLPTSSSPVFQLLQKNAAPWDDELSRLFFQRLRDWFSRAHHFDWELQFYGDFMATAGLRVNPALYESLQTGWKEDSPLWRWWEKRLDACLQTLLFRRQMRKALEQD